MSAAEKHTDKPDDVAADNEARGRGQSAPALPDLDAGLDQFYKEKQLPKPHRAIIVALFPWIYQKEAEEGHDITKLYEYLKERNELTCSLQTFRRVYKDEKRSYEEQKRIEAAAQGRVGAAPRGPRPVAEGPAKVTPVRGKDDL